MGNTPEPTDFSTASHAYEHAEHAGDHPTHRLDVTDAPRWPARPRSAPDRPMQHVVTHTHQIDSPTKSAFKFGFGFAAGVGAFRLLVLIVVWTILAIAIYSLVMRAFPS